MDDYIDQDVLAKTVKLRVTSTDGRPVTYRPDLLPLLSQMLDEDDLMGLWKTGDTPDWYLTFAEQDVMYRFSTTSERTLRGGEKVQVISLNRREVKFRIHWYPLSYKLVLLEEFLSSRFGREVTLIRDKGQLKNGKMVFTGAVTGQMVCTEQQFRQIPYQATVYNAKVLIVCMGRPTLCLKCGELGHQRARCTNPPKRKTYAAAAARHSDDDNLSSEGPPHGSEVLETTRVEGPMEGSEVTGSGESAPPSTEVPTGGESARESAEVPTLQSSEGTRPSTEVLETDKEKGQKRNLDSDDEEGSSSAKEIKKEGITNFLPPFLAKGTICVDLD